MRGIALAVLVFLSEAGFFTGELWTGPPLNDLASRTVPRFQAPSNQFINTDYARLSANIRQAPRKS